MTQATSDTAFKEAYSKLNLEQKEAVDSIEGPVMVVAGPGTGKTQILTLRIANILLKTDATPGNILALTFTESGAKAMRDRLRGYIGATAYLVPIFTFHGFAQKLIQDYPDAYKRVVGGRPINDIEKINTIETIINGGEIKALRPMGDPSYYVMHVIRILAKLKQEYLTPDKFSELIGGQEKDLLAIEKIHTKGAHKGTVRVEYTNKEKSLLKNRELLFIYRQYEALLSQDNFYDFEDMIVETVKALSGNEDMLRDLQETYQYILADEHQDVNGSQNKILELLASFHTAPNIFAVGDEKQAIYRFQGASLQNFLQFTEVYPDTKLISLTKNYRSGQIILDAAHSLVRVESGPLSNLRIPLKAVKTNSQSSIIEKIFSHQAVEESWLVDSVKKQMAEGVPENEIAVIVRTNYEVESLATLLRQAGVPVTASADGDILKHPITHTVLGLINSVSSLGNQSAIFETLHASYWGLSSNDLFKILAAQNFERSLWTILTNEKILQEIGVIDLPTIKKIVTVITDARKLESSEPPHRVLEFLVKKSGLLNYLMESDPLEGARVLRRIYDEVESLVSHENLNNLRQISQAFKKRAEYGLSLNAPYIATNVNSVQVMTAHKSKGLEFEIVYLPHLNDRLWGGSVKKKYFKIPLNESTLVDESEFSEDERRLLYVALTRAKEKLFLSTSETNTKGDPLLPTRLLLDIDLNTIKKESVTPEEENFNPLGVLNNTFTKSNFDKSLLLKVLSERGFSATSLNNYLSSPWDYLYRNVLRVPEIQPTHMQFGTVMHNVLEYATRYHFTHGKLPKLADIKVKLEQELNRLPINNEEFVRLKEKSLEALVVYLEHLKKTLPKETKEEMKFRVVLPTGVSELPEVTLTGKLDRLDFDTSGRVSRVVDYKTGKPKSRNVIEGKTKDADGAYKRQLVFYALLLTLHDDERFICYEGVLSFVEPDAKGHIREEAFTVTVEEIEALKQTIIGAVKEIITGDFLSQSCDPNESDYCHLAQAFLA